MAQKFRQNTARMAYLCPHVWGLSWKEQRLGLGRSEGSPTRMADGDAGCRLKAQLGFCPDNRWLLHAPWASSEYGVWAPRTRVPKERARQALNPFHAQPWKSQSVTSAPFVRSEALRPAHIYKRDWIPSCRERNVQGFVNLFSNYHRPHCYMDSTTGACGGCLLPRALCPTVTKVSNLKRVGIEQMALSPVLSWCHPSPSLVCEKEVRWAHSGSSQKHPKNPQKGIKCGPKKMVMYGRQALPINTES